MIPYGKQTMDQADIKAVIEVLRSNCIAQGPKVKEFEQSLAKYTGAKYAVVCNNGTAGLLLSYLTLGLKPGDEVITTPNTFASTCNMLVFIGVKPVFVDIRLDTYNIDEKKIVQAITKKTKAIVPVHFAGQACEMDKIKKIAVKYKLAVVEDACHALGARFKNSKIGNCRYSDMAIFAFHPVKPITTGEGGAILTNNEKYYQRLALLRNHGIYKDNRGKNVMVELGLNLRLTDIQAALGVSQLKKLDGFIKQRRRIVEWYRQELKNLKEIIMPTELASNYSGWHIYIIRVAKPELRDKLKQYLEDNGVGVNFHYPAVYSHPYYQKLGLGKKLANEEVYQNSCITLPCFPALTIKEVKYISELIRKFFNK
ncbi:MAG: UDP-4-amino-4,6-dideoxy-N-acetyl-beta-L-altrosamine transaminase [Candidatus Falkowbacteria bacterium]